MNTHDRTFENSLCIAYTNCSVKRANDATEPEMSAMTMISGFEGFGRLNLGSTGTPAVLHRVTHGLAEVEVAAPPMPPALCEAGRERARQRVDRLLELLHLVARRVHEVDVLGQRLAQRARHRLDAPVGNQAPPDLRLDHLLQDLQPAFEVFAREPLVERAVADLVLVLGVRHHLAGETVDVELPQRAVQVVRTADRTARLHACEPRDRGRRDHLHLGPVHAHQRVEQQLRELLVRQLAHRAAGIHRTAQLVEAGLVLALAALAVLARLHAGREHREVDLEHRVEHAVVARVLHERRAEAGLERIAVGERHVLDRAHRVEVLGHRHGQPRRAQLVHEALEHVEHVRLGRKRRGHGAHLGGHRFDELRTVARPHLLTRVPRLTCA